jgi:hypothetical protein
MKQNPLEADSCSAVSKPLRYFIFTAPRILWDICGFEWDICGLEFDICGLEWDICGLEWDNVV